MKKIAPPTYKPQYSYPRGVDVMDEGGTTESGYKVSKFNSAGLQNTRLDELWRDVRQQIKNGKYKSWNIALDIIWTELAGDLDQATEEEKNLKKLNKEISEAGSLIEGPKKGFESFDEDELDRLDKHYTQLLEKTLLLRRLQNRLGKGSSYEDSAEDDID